MLLKALVTLTVAGNLIGFGMAIRRHFARPEGMPLGTRLMIWLGYPFGLLRVGSHALREVIA
jgi:hypothetical protein